MTKAELTEILRNGEHSAVEFKLDRVTPRDLAQELVAFANFQGGMVILGVGDDGTIHGITRDRLKEWIMSVCRDKVRPELIPHFERLHGVEPSKDVAVVRIGRGWTAHHVWHHNHRSYYIRVGSQSREAAPEELERLFQQRGGFRVEIRPVQGAGLEALDMRRLLDYFHRVRNQETPAIGNPEDWTHFIPHAGIDAVAFPGTDKAYATIERAMLRGPLLPLFSEAGLVENGIVEEAIHFVRRNTPVTAYLEDGIRRVERSTYPVEVIREVVVNALVHRDYLLSGSDSELVIYSDRLEVTSPGRLPNGVTPERMRYGVRATRNQLLVDILRDYGYVERLGMGISRKVITGMREHNGTEPDLIEDGERFTVRLWRGSTL